ncbi:uncharacterized protein METZ01_LOCUS147863 [marine metagenome]|uniref:Pentapeptide repeat-containing protein n=1 Tax=marine metagenome TaxID=408172 RepID=A0A382A0R4_9ZZZZ
MANLTGAELKEADLPRKNLTRANLSRANRIRAGLTGAFADEDTIWPEGFDPEAAGVIFG